MKGPLCLWYDTVSRCDQSVFFSFTDKMPSQVSPTEKKLKKLSKIQKRVKEKGADDATTLASGRHEHAHRAHTTHNKSTRDPFLSIELAFSCPSRGFIYTRAVGDHAGAGQAARKTRAALKERQVRLPGAAPRYGAGQLPQQRLLRSAPPRQPKNTRGDPL